MAAKKKAGPSRSGNKKKAAGAKGAARKDTAAGKKKTATGSGRVSTKKKAVAAKKTASKTTKKTARKTATRKKVVAGKKTATKKKAAKATASGSKAAGARRKPAAGAKAATGKAGPTSTARPDKADGKRKTTKKKVATTKKPPVSSKKKATGSRKPAAAGSAPAKAAAPVKPKAPAKAQSRKAGSGKAVRRRMAGAGAVSGPAEYMPYERSVGEDYMNGAQIAHFREILTAWRRELMEEVDRTVHHLKDDAGTFPDPNDRATQEEEFALELRTRDRERKLIRKIDESLSALDGGDYGYCEICGVEIGVQRLEARPTATLCIDCKTLDEIRERQHI